MHPPQLLISGSLAYDKIMNFPDSFRNHILPDKLHILNVSFVVDKLKVHFGGTGGNIAYTAKMLGVEPVLVSALGADGGKYRSYLEALEIDVSHIAQATSELTSTAMITTDQDDNQITAFFSGASRYALEQVFPVTNPLPLMAIISPNDKDVMKAHLQQCHDAGIPYCFDPGQQTTTFSGEELRELISGSQFLIGNDYEIQLILDRCEWTLNELLEHTHQVVTTLGSHGSKIQTKEFEITVPAVSVASVDDPTGAGDAYRAGFFTAYIQGKGLEICARMGSVAASFAIEHYGTQMHEFTKEMFETRYEEAYGEGRI